MRIIIFGGMFDPPHIGHMHIARDAASKLKADKVIWVPSSQPPHRETPSIPASERYYVLKEWSELNPGNEVSDIELSDAHSGYSIETVRSFKRHYPEEEMYLLIGSDEASSFSKWKDWEMIIKLLKLAVAERSGGNSIPPAAEERTVFLGNLKVDISSSSLKSKISKGEEISHLIDPDIHRLLLERGLYSFYSGA